MLAKTQSRIKPAIPAEVDSSHSLARGLAGCWLLNEGVGQIVHDASGHRHDGSLSGNPGWSTGLFGHAIYFDGNDDWISMGNCLNLGTDDITVLALVRYSAISQPDSWGEYRIGAIAGKGYVDGSSAGYGLYVSTDNRVHWQICRQMDGFEATSDGVLNDGQWRLVIGVCDRDSTAGVRLYVDGVRQGATADATALNGIALNGSRAFAVGSRQDEANGTWFWDLAGSVALVCVWKRVLAEAEIRNLHQDPFGLFVARHAIARLTASPGSLRQCTGVIHGSASASAMMRVTHALASRSVASASIGGTLIVVGIVPLSGKVSSRAGLRAALCTTTSQVPPKGVPQAERAWRKEALFNGMTPAAFKLGTVLTQGWFWVRHRGCTAVYRGSGITQVDLARILYVAEPDAREIRLPTYLSHTAGSTHCYLVRRFNSCGDEDRTKAAAAALHIGSDGHLAEPRPNVVVRFTAEQTSGTGLRLAWFYCPLDQGIAPGWFDIYRRGTGAITPDIPIGITDYKGRRYCCYHSDTLVDGQYTFVVSAASAEGLEGVSSIPLVCQITTSPPEPAVILAATSI